MRNFTAVLLLGLFAGSIEAQDFDDDGDERFPSYKVASEVNTTPVQNTLMTLAGGSLVYLRDSFSIHGSLVFPLKEYETGVTTLPVGASSTRSLPILLQGGGSIHFWSPSIVDFYVPMMAGFEINRNDSDLKGFQTFIEIGGGMQFFIDALFVLRFEYAYHFSYIPQTNDTFLDHHYHRGSTSVGFFF